ncbi:MAG: hypothetical protein RR929_01370 [Erysipelotrichaceae bacterium]
MFKKNFEYLTMITSGIFFTIFGFNFIFNSDRAIRWVHYAFVIGLLVISILGIINIIINKKITNHRFGKIFDGIIWLGLGILCLANELLFYKLLFLIMGLWIGLHAIVKIIVLYTKIKDRLPGKLSGSIFLFFDLFISITLLTNPEEHGFLLTKILGVYLTVYGINFLLQLLRNVAPTSDELANKIQIALPPSISSWIPLQLIHFILKVDEDESKREAFKVVKDDIKTDLEILVHLAPHGPAMMGHVDVIYKEQAISYACYDPHTAKLHGSYGEGVVLIADRNEYLHNCLANENKMLISFGINLNEEQKKEIDKSILSMLGNTERFYSDEERKRLNMEPHGDGDNYISRVTKNCEHSYFYKIKEGRFKTFFVLSSNCVAFTSKLTECVGLHLFDFSGIVSPGSYYDFLNKKFLNDKSFIVSKKIFTKKDAQKFIGG